MIGADQVFAHAVGDYILQSDWMANEKTKRSVAAAAHAITYTAVFLFITQNPIALAIIGTTHFAIDRWRLARFVVYAKNFFAPRGYWYAWSDCANTGYHKDRAPFLAVWLLIIADNIMHVGINALALRYFA